MFKNARIKLTIWYSLIILLISTSFSIAMYRMLTLELNRIERMHILRIEHGPIPLIPGLDNNINIRNSLYLDPALIEEAKERLTIILGIINVIILGVTATGGYFLAGRTLKPIEKMMDDQKRFVADASHELRTPLTSIKTEIEVAFRDKNLNFSDTKKLLKSNLEEVDKMQKLTNYLLNLNRYQENTTQLTFSKIDLNKLVEKVITEMLPLAKVKKLKIQKELEKTKIFGNEDSLKELIKILLDNAIKYSFLNGNIIVRTKKTGANITLEVEDFGQGIFASDLPHVFNRFYRADPSRTKNRTDGFGLGLAIAKNICSLHQGKISVRSKPKKGSLFIINFPAYSQE